MRTAPPITAHDLARLALMTETSVTEADRGQLTVWQRASGDPHVQAKIAGLIAALDAQ